MGPGEQSITFMGVVLLVANIYFDSSIPLWQQLYKSGQIAHSSASDASCSELHSFIEAELGGACYHPAEDMTNIYAPQCSYDEGTGVGKTESPCVCGYTTCVANESRPLWCNYHESLCKATSCAGVCRTIWQRSTHPDATSVVCEMDECDGCEFCHQLHARSLDVDSRSSPLVAARRLDASESMPKRKLIVEGSTKKEMEGINCPYYCVRDPQQRKTREGKDIYWRKAQTFSKGAALFVQATTGTLIFWAVNYYFGGMEQLQRCFLKERLLRFGPIGMCFGLSAVFSFMAQGKLSPGSYALYAQSGVVIIPILWRIAFCKPLAAVTWMHIILIASGIVLYFLPNFPLFKAAGDAFDSEDAEGLMWVALKVMGSALGTIGAELFLKGGDHPPLTVSMAYILPWKALGCLITCPILEWDDFIIGYKYRHGWIFHDWNTKLVLIVGHNLGDTCMSGVIAYFFDSVVKAICGVVGIICPTWLVSSLLGWEKLSLHTLAGCVQMAGGVVVVTGAFAYAVGRAMASELEELSLKVAAAEPPPSIAKRFSVMRAEPKARRSTFVPLDAANMMEAEYTQKDAEIENKRESIRASIRATNRGMELVDRA